jgi:hypothetical protein
VLFYRPQEHGWEWDDRRVTIEIVGSCCTLVARKLIESAPGLLTSQVALLLFGKLIFYVYNHFSSGKTYIIFDKYFIN